MIEAIKPHPAQERFLSTPADIAVFGGAAGGGKTWGLLIEPIRHVHNPNFSAVIFRRTSPQIRNEGGLWDESHRIYPALGATSHEVMLEWRFPSGATVRFAHMQHEKNRFDWQGAQIPMIGFDELTHFTEQQFFYMFSRNRSTCGVRPYIRATCNPDAGSWVAEFLSWWIDQETGYPIPDRAGRLRYMTRINDVIHWADKPDELIPLLPKEIASEMDAGLLIKSVTFIPATIYDNPTLLAANPEYLANLMALPLVERERLLGGNWKISAEDGIFRRDWFRRVERAPEGLQWVRYWDLAASVRESADYTASAAVAFGPDGTLYIRDMIRGRWEWPDAKKRIIQTMLAEPHTIHGIEEALHGLAAVQELRREVSIAHVRFHGVRVDRDKLARALPWAARAEAGKVALVEGPWIPAFLAEACAFRGDGTTHDDQIDSVSGGVQMLASIAQPVELGPSIYD
jgi:predicted phage terminase large subunit-like protein